MKILTLHPLVIGRKSAGSGLVYLDYFGKMVQCQVSKCSLLVPSTDGCRRRTGIETIQVEAGYTTVAVDEAKGDVGSNTTLHYKR